MQVILTVSVFCVRAGDSRCSLILCEQVIASCSFCVRESDSHCFFCVNTGDSCRFCAVRAQVILVDSICGHVCDSHCFCWRAQVTLVASVWVSLCVILVVCVRARDSRGVSLFSLCACVWTWFRFLSVWVCACISVWLCAWFTLCVCDLTNSNQWILILNIIEDSTGCDISMMLSIKILWCYLIIYYINTYSCTDTDTH